jgi:ferric-dicitrate binding protein FerR (iron transport regulator)
VSGGNKNGKPGGETSRWLEGAQTPAAQALRQALDDGPLDDDPFARQRVWNRVQVPWAGEAAPPSARRRRLWPVLVPVLALSGVAAAALLGGRRLMTPPQLASTPVSSPALPDVVALPPPATIALTTGPDEEARHRLARGVSVELAPRSALIPGDDVMPPEVKVGRIRFSVPHQAPGRRYAVRAGGYQVLVLGTTFDVAVEDAGVGVSVSSGVVAIEDAGSGR